MQFKLTDKQVNLQNKFKDFCQKEISPRAKEVDEKEEFSGENWKALQQFGFFGIPYPEEWGGENDIITFSILTEELSRVCASTSYSASLPLVECGGSILQYGKEDIRSKYLPKIAKGELICAFALTEESGGSDFLSIKTTAKKENNGYILEGKKTFVTNGNIADIILVFAKIPDKGNISAFVVERKTEGVMVGEKLSKMGLRGSPTYELIFKECKISEKNLLEEDGSKVVNFALSCGKIIAASWCLGIAQAALDESVKHAEKRYAFGKPIGYFQEINHKIADMKVLTDTARQLIYYAGWLKNTGADYKIPSSIAKLFAAEAAVKCCSWAVEIYGGYGLIKGSKVERLYRDVKFGEISCGTQQMQRNIISEELLKD